MRRSLLILQGSLFVCFNFFLLLTVFQVTGGGPSLTGELRIPVYDQKEDFDPSLQRLNSISKLADYCDSVYREAIFTKRPAGNWTA